MSEHETIELYKTFVDSSLRLTERRQAANRFNLTVVSGVTVATWVVLTTASMGPKLFILIAITATLLIGLLGRGWKKTIQYYRTLSSAKFTVIHKLEKQLSFSPFKDEWDIIKKGDASQKNLTYWEETVPNILSVLYWPSVIAIVAYTVVFFWFSELFTKIPL